MPAEDCVPIRRDSLAHSVTWRCVSPVDPPRDRDMIRIHLDTATVYALSLSQ